MARFTVDRTPVLERLEARSVALGDCVVWTGYTDAKGYGHLWVLGERTSVHRAAWIARYGAIPLETPCVLHHCDNPPCWADGHLYLGTHTDNMRDAVRRGRNSRLKRTHCKQGHPFDAENTYRYPDGRRACRTCRLGWHN